MDFRKYARQYILERFDKNPRNAMDDDGLAEFMMDLRESELEERSDVGRDEEAEELDDLPDEGVQVSDPEIESAVVADPVVEDSVPEAELSPPGAYERPPDEPEAVTQSPEASPEPPVTQPERSTVQQPEARSPDASDALTPPEIRPFVQSRVSDAEAAEMLRDEGVEVTETKLETGTETDIVPAALAADWESLTSAASYKVDLPTVEIQLPGKPSIEIGPVPEVVTSTQNVEDAVMRQSELIRTFERRAF